MVIFESIFKSIVIIALTIGVLYLVIIGSMIMYDSYLDLKMEMIQKKNRLKKIKHKENDIN